MGPRSFKIWITGPKIWSAPPKTDLPYNFCFINFFPSLTVEAVDALQTLFRASPDPGGPPRGPKHSLWPGLCKVRAPYHIWWGLVQWCGFLYRTHTHTHTDSSLYIRWLLTMAPEAHGAQVLPDLDYGPKTIICPGISATWPIFLLGRCCRSFILEILPENDWLWLQKHMGPRSFQIQIMGPKL